MMGGVRLTDPRTSFLAYEQMRSSGALSERRLEVICALARMKQPTSGEIADIIGGNRNNVATRVSELVQMGIVEEVGVRPCRISGKECIVWQMTGSTTPKKLARRDNATLVLKKQVADLERRLTEALSAQRSEADAIVKIIGDDSEPDPLELGVSEMKTCTAGVWLRSAGGSCIVVKSELKDAAEFLAQAARFHGDDDG